MSVRVGVSVLRDGWDLKSLPQSRLQTILN